MLHLTVEMIPSYASLIQTSIPFLPCHFPSMDVFHINLTNGLKNKCNL